jgi:pilus assembly protein CpaC
LIVIVTPEIVAPIPAGQPLPSLKFPEKFLTPNSGIPMNTPDEKTSANTQVAPPTTISVEKLIESMKPETPLSIGGGFSSDSSTSSAATAASSSSSQQ